MSAVYGSSPIRRRRRSQAEMEAIRAALNEILAEGHPMTVRQVFYQATTAGVVAKTEAEYKGTVCRLLADMRRDGEIPYTWLADATRWMRKPTTFSSAEAALKRTAETYRRALWDDSAVAVEIWLEKEALAGVLVEVTDAWDVPLMVTRGYPSMSFLYSAAAAIKSRSDHDQRTKIYYFGDYDPSGRDIDRAVVSGIGESLQTLEVAEFSVAATFDAFFDDSEPEWTFEAYADFERIGVTKEQIEHWELPTRPTKKTDTRSKTFKGDSVELDAILADRLRELARECIEQHVDQHQLGVLQKAEAEERRLLLEMAETLNGDPS
jgi:hypothetical protein